MEKATRQHTREHNLSLVLKNIYSHPSVSRADIARSTGLTRTTVSEIVADLMAEGLVVETGPVESPRGKPPICLAVDDNARHIICVNLGEKYFSGALLNLRGHICHRLPEVHPRKTSAQAVDVTFEQLDALMRAAEKPVLGIGIGTPGHVDKKNGIIRRAVNLDWNDMPLKSMLEARYSVPVYVANDAHLAALAEYTYGDHNCARNLIAIKTGEGIGAGVIASGRLVDGGGVGTSEIGHIPVGDPTVLCRCGNYGCMEAVSSANAILHGIQQAAQENPALFDGVSAQGITIDMVCDAYVKGSGPVVQVVDRAAGYLGMAIACIVGAFGIRKVLISGGLTRLGPSFLEAVSTKAQRHILFNDTYETSISFSTLAADNVLMGASALVLAEELELP